MYLFISLSLSMCVYIYIYIYMTTTTTTTTTTTDNIDQAEAGNLLPLRPPEQAVLHCFNRIVYTLCNILLYRVVCYCIFSHYIIWHDMM